MRERERDGTLPVASVVCEPEYARMLYLPPMLGSVSSTGWPLLPRTL